MLLTACLHCLKCDQVTGIIRDRRTIITRSVLTIALWFVGIALAAIASIQYPTSGRNVNGIDRIVSAKNTKNPRACEAWMNRAKTPKTLCFCQCDPSSTMKNITNNSTVITNGIRKSSKYIFTTPLGLQLRGNRTRFKSYGSRGLRLQGVL